MAKKSSRQVSFWIDKQTMGTLDEFMEKQNYVSRSKFIIDSMMIVFYNPILLKIRKFNPVDFDLVKKLVEALDKSKERVPLNPTEEEIKRIQEIQEELK